MPNNFNTLKNAPGVVAKMAAAMLADQMVFAKSIDKADPTDFDGKNGYNSGDTIYVSKPARFIPTTNPDITSAISDIVEEKVALPLDIRYTLGVNVTSADLVTEVSLKAWANRVLKPAVSSIAQYAENAMIAKATQAVFNTVGTAGSTVFDTDTSLAAGQKITENACPYLDDRFIMLNAAANRSAVNARKGLFQQSTAIAEQYSKGYMGTADGFDYLTSNLVYKQTNGNDVTGVAIASAVLAPATGATQIGVNGLTNTTGTLTKGSVFTIAGVNAVDPITKQDLGYLQQFTATTSVTANGSGQATVGISPTIYSSASGALQNVTALPVDTAALVFVGVASATYAQNLAYHKSAFRMVSVPLLDVSSAVLECGQETVDGFTIRVVKDYLTLQDKMVMRLDFLGGLVPVRPEWATRLTA